MVNNRQITAVFAALADPTRRDILGRLSTISENSVATLLKPFQMSAPAISRHLRVLESANLIERRREGRRHFIRARSEGLQSAREWMNQCMAAWEFSFDALDKVLAKERKVRKP
ncbi:MAG TPA: metalloregulator ArsR/SmtB family transcription factor [Bryobacteraceae bacterium]|nr:metalloregulator ArsR/SmtB family transcription factor [Bryobacteraceae bacterium]